MTATTCSTTIVPCNSKTGRLLLPVALHQNETNDPARFNGRGVVMVYSSDHKGQTWRRSRTTLKIPPRAANGLPEPSIVELKDGRLLMFLRTSIGHAVLLLLPRWRRHLE